MIDALDFEHVERLPHVRRRAFFAGMGNGAQAEFAALGKHPRKFLRRMPDFAGIQTDTNELAEVRTRLFQRDEGIGFTEMAQKTQDQFSADAELGFGTITRTLEAIDDGGECNTAFGVRLRIEEQLGMDDVVGLGTQKICPRHVEEILLGDQHAGASVIDIQKALQIAECIGGAQCIDIGVRQADAIALPERKDQLRLQRAFDVDVQFGLRHATQKLSEGGIERMGIGHGAPVRSVESVCPIHR